MKHPLPYLLTKPKKQKKKSQKERDRELAEYLSNGGTVEVLPPCKTLPTRRVRVMERKF